MNPKIDDLLEGLAKDAANADAYVEALWTLFDLVAAETTQDQAERVAEKGMEKIGLSRGVSAASLRKFRQRGRTLARYRDEISKLPRWQSPMGFVQIKERELLRLKCSDTDLDLALINSILNASQATQSAVIELVVSGRLRAKQPED